MRILISLGFGIAIAVCLFLGMQIMTTSDANVLKKSEPTPHLIYLSQTKESEINKKSRIKPKKEPQKQKPKPKKIIKTNINNNIDQKIDIKPLKVQNIDVSTKAFLSSPKVNVAPSIVDASMLQASKRVNPRYPRAAKKRGKEGYVKLQFVILPNGSVQNPIVIESSPDDTFNEEALRAISKWRFKNKSNEGSKTATITFNFRLVK